MKLTKNFNLVEFQSKDGAPTPDDISRNLHALAHELQKLRNHIAAPIHVISGYRSPAHNKRVGGAKASQHLYGRAADITTKSHTPRQLATIIEKLIKEGKMQQGGLGVYKTFVHYDIRGHRARW